MTAKPKPMPGHKLKAVQCFFQAACECGWRSGMHGTKGARTGALDDWHEHKRRCQAVMAEAR